jgi:adenylate cyclase
MKALNEAVYRQKVLFLWVAVAFLATGLAISFGLAKILTKPLLTLAEAMQTVARGDVSMQIKVRHRDEIGRLTEVFNQMILSLREKLHMEKYLSGSAVKSIRKHRDAAHLTLGGETKHVTALFSDVRGFTAMSEKMTPEEVVRHLNIYLNLQAKVIHQWGGMVDKFVGDEVMAIFEGEGEEVNAARAAVEIQHYCQTLNEARSAAGEQQIHIGIGLNSGDAVMGNMGSEDHMDYTVIGDTINTAARLCSVARAGQIVASKTIADQIENMSTLNKLDPVMVKGKDKPIDIHEVIDVKGAARREMRHAADVMVEYRLAGLADDKGRALAKDLSSWGCMLEVATPIGLGSRLTVNIDLQTLGNITVDGTVHHIRKTDSRYLIGVHFLGIQDSLRYRIVEWVHQVESETHKIDSGVTGIA